MALVPAVGLALAAALVLALALALVLALILALVLVVLELVVWCWCAGWALGLGSTGGVRARPRYSETDTTVHSVPGAVLQPHPSSQAHNRREANVRCTRAYEALRACVATAAGHRRSAASGASMDQLTREREGAHLSN